MALVKLFSGTSSYYLADKIANEYGKQLGNLSVEKFKDQEMQPAFNESVRGAEVYIIQSTHAPAENLMELLLIVDAARRASAKYVTAVIPYFGYARQDRKARPRVAIGAKLVANLLMAAGIDRIMTCDLHAGQIQGFFDVPVDHFDASAVFVPHIRDLALDDMVFASPDVGGVVRTTKYAKYFGVPMVVCHKERRKANEIETITLLGDVSGANVVLVDDLIDTGGTLIKAAELLINKGAKSVRAICTHPVLSGDACTKIEGSVLSEVIVTDTIPLKNPNNPKITTLSVAKLFADGIKRVHNHESISTLFI